MAINCKRLRGQAVPIAGRQCDPDPGHRTDCENERGHGVIRTPARSVSNTGFHHSGDEINAVARKVVRTLEGRVDSVGLDGECWLMLKFTRLGLTIEPAEAALKLASDFDKPGV
jgi:hypothetical protein